MQFEEFKESMLRSAALHDARIAQIEESLTRITNVLDHMVENRIELQEDFDHRWSEMREEFDRRWRMMDERYGQWQRESQARQDRIDRQIDATQRQIDSLSTVVMRHITNPAAHRD
jgi:chromosome segregation ATPase